MSIWCSLPTIGHDDWPDDDDEPTGEVRSYANGFSNHYPTTDGTVEREASIDLAYLPPYCVPGRRDDPWADNGTGPWLRLGVTSWEHDWYHPTSVKQRESADVVLDVAAVQVLADQLNEWLDRTKVYPTDDAEDTS